MPKTPTMHSVRWSLAAVILATLTTLNTLTLPTTAIAGSFTRGCAARDMQVLMLIEDRESRNTMPAEKLRDAVSTLMHARIVCHEGHVLDALAIYDGIAKSIAPNPVQSGRTRPIEIE